MVAETELIGVERKFVRFLREIWDNDHFVIGVRSCLKTDEEREMIMQAYRDGELLDSDDISLYALDIHTDREESA